MTETSGMDRDASRLSEDGLLDRAVMLRQPTDGYRAGSDAVLLAAAVPAKPGERVLDVGAGVGAAALCLARRCSGVTVIGIELQADLAALAADNAWRNDLTDRVTVVAGDIRQPPNEIASVQFDHVMCNPPFYPAAAATPSPDEGKATAHQEAADADLAVWVRFCLKRARPGGSVTVIHRAERLPDLLTELTVGAGAVRILPLRPMAGRPAKRVIVQARAGRQGPALLLPGLVLHADDGGDTEAARALLRRGAAIDMETGRCQA